jgi:hypothetical protein
MDLITFSSLIAAFVALVKTYAGFGIIVIAAFVLFFVVMIFDRHN